MTKNAGLTTALVDGDAPAVASVPDDAGAAKAAREAADVKAAGERIGAIKKRLAEIGKDGEALAKLNTDKNKARAALADYVRMETARVSEMQHQFELKHAEHNHRLDEARVLGLEMAKLEEQLKA